jgi:hypothetical protein
MASLHSSSGNMTDLQTMVGLTEDARNYVASITEKVIRQPGAGSMPQHKFVRNITGVMWCTT